MNFGSGGGGSGGLFSAYTNYMNYKNTKAQEAAQRANLGSQLTQANNNLAVTQQQAPLVPQQAADSFAARGVGQSTFGNGMGNQWSQGAKGSPQEQQFQFANPQGQPGGTLNGPTVDSHAVPNPPPLAGPVSGPAPNSAYQHNNANVTQGPTSGEGQPIGTGLQRANTLASSMLSNANAQQTAAQTALHEYNKQIKNNRDLYYLSEGQDILSTLMMFGGM